MRQQCVGFLARYRQEVREDSSTKEQSQIEVAPFLHKICKEQDAWLHNTRRKEHTCALGDRISKSHADSLANFRVYMADIFLSRTCRNKI